MPTPRTEASPWPARIATGLITAVLLGPLLVSGGFALRGDMVFVPHQPWKSAWLGLDGSVPRSAPMDAVIWSLGQALPGALVQRVVLVVIFVVAGLGVGRLACGFTPFGQVAAVTVYLWNPWVHDRLAIGQWAMIGGYALLPWVVLAAVRIRDRRPAGWSAGFLGLLVAAVCAPSFGLIATVLAAAVVACGRSWRRTAGVVGLGVVANLPWIVPGLLGPGLRGSEDAFHAFAARGETSWGALVSLLSTGGTWKSSVVAPERTHGLLVAAAALLALMLLAAFRRAAPILGGRTWAALAGVGGGSLLVAAAPTISPVADALGSLSVHAPALGILRDSQRYLAPFCLVLALGAAALVDLVLERASADRTGSALAAGLVVAAPVLLLPSLAWGLAGGLRAVDYPDDWARVAETVATRDGATVVLPWTGSYRGFAWNDRRAVLDPAQRFLPGEVLVDDRTFLGSQVLPSEDPFLVRVGVALGVADPSVALRQLGIRWVLVERDNYSGAVPAGTTVLDTPSLRLVDLGRPENNVPELRHEPPVWPVSLLDALTASGAFISIAHISRHLRRKGA